MHFEQINLLTLLDFISIQLYLVVLFDMFGKRCSPPHRLNYKQINAPLDLFFSKGKLYLRVDNTFRENYSEKNLIP